MGFKGRSLSLPSACDGAAVRGARFGRSLVLGRGVQRASRTTELRTVCIRAGHAPSLPAGRSHGMAAGWAARHGRAAHGQREDPACAGGDCRNRGGSTVPGAHAGSARAVGALNQGAYRSFTRHLRRRRTDPGAAHGCHLRKRLASHGSDRTPVRPSRGGRGAPFRQRRPGRSPGDVHRGP